MIKTIAQFGTFEVDNFGDLLFPLILEWELALRLPSFQLQLFSPLANKSHLHPIFQNNGTVTPCSADAVIIGGGDLISFSLDIAADYKRQWNHLIGPHAACWAIPSIHHSAPLLWNAPGVPFPFTQEQAPLVRALASKACYLSVRDEYSKRHLQEAGVSEPIAIVPDTAILLPNHWTKESLAPLAQKLLKPFQLEKTPFLAFQMHPGLERSIPQIAEVLDHLSQSLQQPIVLLPIGFCHQDHRCLSRLHQEAKGRFHFLHKPLDCKSVAAVIAHAGSFIGTSLHGNITAFAYGVPHLIYHAAKLKKLEGFAKLIQEPNRLMVDLRQMIEAQTLLQTIPSRATYQRLVEQATLHFNTIAHHLSHAPKATMPNVDFRDSYLSLLHVHQKLDRQIQAYQGYFLLDLFVAYGQFLQRCKRIASPLKSQKFWMIRLAILAIKLFLKYKRKIFRGIFKHLYLLFETEPMKIVPMKEWRLTLQERGTEKIVSLRMKEDLRLFTKTPLISCLLQIDRTNLSHLKESIDSVLSQYYPYLELCITSNLPFDPQIKAIVEEYQKGDPRIKLLPMQEILSIIEGEYIAILNPHDCLSRDAFYEMVRKIHVYPEADLLYSDEDTISQEGLFTNPFHKPSWCPDSFLSRNYLGHLTFIRKRLILQVGGFEVPFHEYDLLLKLTEKTSHIVHVPKILYHRRVAPSSSQNTEEKNIHAITAAIKRRNEQGQVEPNLLCAGCYTIRYLPPPSSKVSILIPTKDQTAVLKRCIDSIYSKTDDLNFELICVSNNSQDTQLFELLQEYKKTHGDAFHFYERNIPFNYSKLMNEAAAKATGDYLLFLNNDTEILSRDWIREMTGQAARRSIGAVGCKLLYFNDTIQHAGIVLGQKKYLGSHAFVGERRHAPGYFFWLNTINNYSALTSACLLCRKNVFDEVQGFDEEMKVDCSDLDFCLKLKERGYQNVYLPHVELYHHESLTRGDLATDQKSLEQLSRTEKIIRTRWEKYLEHDPCYSIHLNELGNFKS